MGQHGVTRLSTPWGARHRRAALCDVSITYAPQNAEGQKVEGNREAERERHSNKEGELQER